MMKVPVHGQVRVIDELNAIHADVVRRGLGLAPISGMDRMDACEGDVATLTGSGSSLFGCDGPADSGWIPIERPALDDGQPCEIDFST